MTRLRKDLTGLGEGLLVLNGDFRIEVCFWNKVGLLLEQFYVSSMPTWLAKDSLQSTVTDAREALEVRRVKSKKRWDPPSPVWNLKALTSVLVKLEIKSQETDSRCVLDIDN
jgi:hypothetical protein